MYIPTLDGAYHSLYWTSIQADEYEINSNKMYIYVRLQTLFYVNKRFLQAVQPPLSYKLRQVWYTTNIKKKKAYSGYANLLTLCLDMRLHGGK